MNPQSWPLRARLEAGVASGLLLLLAFPPVDQGWVALLGLVPLLLALRGASARAGALLGFCCGLAFFGILLYWISYFGWLAWGGLVLAQSGFLALFGLLAARASRIGALGRVAGIPALWTGIEMMRARYPLGGFAWGDLGYTQHAGGPGLPLARAGGVFLVGLALVAVNALVAEALAGRGLRARAALGAGALALAFLPALLPLGPAGPRTHDIDVAAVQGNAPRARFAGFARRGRLGPEDFLVVDNHVRESEVLVGDAPDVVIWPENALDRDPIRNPDFFRPVAELARRLRTYLVAGAILDSGDRFRNSNLLIDPRGAIVGRYDKRHLVPFGEYVPWRWVRKIVPALDREVPVDGRAGDFPHTFATRSTRFGSVICFESTYPWLVRDVARQGVDFIVVTTNNASFGTSPAAAQHLAMSRMRAVEHGRAVVHAAIAGISAIVMPDGRIVREAGLFRPAVLRARLPVTVGMTIYTRYGAPIEAAMGVLAGIAAAAALVGRPRARREP